ncbi:MAG: hypothetical protein IH840_00350 [Candidatus Heimdallarchaeota archaeon]|nr:hypothetical protein [Candidatus Heimdallarchaeota archaeon]
MLQTISVQGMENLHIEDEFFKIVSFDFQTVQHQLNVEDTTNNEEFWYLIEGTLEVNAAEVIFTLNALKCHTSTNSLK